VVEVVEGTVDGDISCFVGRSGSQVTLGWEDCCGGDGGGPACFYIRERETTPATGTSVEPNSDDHFPLPQKPRRSVILMTLISFSHFLFNFRNPQ